MNNTTDNSFISNNIRGRHRLIVHTRTARPLPPNLKFHITPDAAKPDIPPPPKPRSLFNLEA